MAVVYNPIVREYWQYRKVFSEVLGVSTRELKPSQKLAELIPVQDRRKVWRSMRARGVQVPELVLSIQTIRCILAVSAMCAIALSICFASLSLLASVVPIAIILAFSFSYSATRLFDDSLTLGTLCLQRMRFRDHRDVYQMAIQAV